MARIEVMNHQQPLASLDRLGERRGHQAGGIAGEHCVRAGDRVELGVQRLLDREVLYDRLGHVVGLSDRLAEVVRAGEAGHGQVQLVGGDYLALDQRLPDLAGAPGQRVETIWIRIVDRYGEAGPRPIQGDRRAHQSRANHGDPLTPLAHHLPPRALRR
jgi:hypothetical protein